MRPAAHEIEEWATMVPWRRSQLRRAGFDSKLAADLAADMRYDVTALLDLAARGCPPTLAARIVAPLGSPPPR